MHLTGAPGETFREMYDAIRPVAIVYGTGRRLYVSEFTSARRLLRELWRIGRHRLRIRGAISELGALSPRNIAAFNCYLEHSFGTQSLNNLRAGRLHRFTWYKMQREIPLTWIR